MAEFGHFRNAGDAEVAEKITDQFVTNRNGRRSFLLIALGGREEESEEIIEAVGPGIFAMDGVGDALVGEIDILPPAETLEQTEEVVGVAEMLCAFGHAHVEPDFEVGASERGFDEAEDAAVVPPDGGGHDRDFAEDLGVFEA